MSRTTSVRNAPYQQVADQPASAPHTPGLLKRDQRILRDQRGLDVASTILGAGYPGGGIDATEAEANARRLLALWNAAARLNLTTNAIECGAIDAAWLTAREQVEIKLKKDRQDLPTAT